MSRAALEFCCEEPLISQSKKEMGYTIANQKKTCIWVRFNPATNENKYTHQRTPS